MIPEVDEALRRLVRQEAVPDESVAIVFEAPTKDWNARRTGPAVNLYLHEVREDAARRHPVSVRPPGDAPALPPVTLRLGYLLTCWTARPEDEHRLLAACLLGLIRHSLLPPGLVDHPVVRGSVGMVVARPDGDPRRSTSLWQALGGELKPSLDLQLTVVCDLGTRYPAGPPVTRPAVLDVDRIGRPESPAGPRERVRGRVRPPLAPDPEPEADPVPTG